MPRKQVEQNLGIGELVKSAEKNGFIFETYRYVAIRALITKRPLKWLYVEYQDGKVVRYMFKDRIVGQLDLDLIELDMSKSQIEKNIGEGELVKVEKRDKSVLRVYKYPADGSLFVEPSKWLYIIYQDEIVVGYELKDIPRPTTRYIYSNHPSGGTMQYHNLTTGEIGTITVY